MFIYTTVSCLLNLTRTHIISNILHSYRFQFFTGYHGNRALTLTLSSKLAKSEILPILKASVDPRRP